MGKGSDYKAPEFRLEPNTFEERAERDWYERAGHVARMLSRVHIDAGLKQAFGYMLAEPSWMVMPVRGMYVNDGVVYTVAMNVTLDTGGQLPAGVMLSATATAHCAEKDILKSVEDAARRAELNEADVEWLLTLPRVFRKG